MSTETTSPDRRYPDFMERYRSGDLHPQDIANEALLLRVASLMADGVELGFDKSAREAKHGSGSKRRIGEASGGR